MDKYQETVEIVVGTETMDFNDFVECVVFNWLVVNFSGRLDSVGE